MTSPEKSNEGHMTPEQAAKDSRVSLYQRFLPNRDLRLVVLPYMLFAGLWIWGSDNLLAWMVKDPNMRLELSIAKGWAFVIITSLLLFSLLRLERANRTKTEKSLAQHEYLYKLLTENATDVIWLFNIESRTLEYISPAILRLNGYTREEFEDSPLERFLTPDSLQRYSEFLTNLKAGLLTGSPATTSHRLELDLYCRWGGTVPVEASIRAMEEVQGPPVRLIGVTRDISAQRKAREEMERNKHWLERAEQIGGLGGWTLNLATRTLWASPEACRIYGLSVSTCNMERIAQIPLPNYRPMLDAKMEGLISRGESYDVEFQIRRPTDGRIVSVHSVAEYDAANAIIFGIIKDITNQKQMELQLMRAQRLDSIGSLAGGLAHDLNNLLAPIRLSTPLIKECLQKQEDVAMVEIIEASATRATELVRQVLSFAKGAQGEHHSLELPILVSQMVTLAKETFPPNIVISVQIPEVLSRIHGNATQVQQVLMNLLVNARDAMPNGGSITITAFPIRSSELVPLPGESFAQGPLVCLAVVDTGTGMTEEVLARLFEPFFSTKAQGKGTGLGLSTVLGIMRGHKGTVRVKSTLGQGTSMELYFPAC